MPECILLEPTFVKNDDWNSIKDVIDLNHYDGLIISIILGTTITSNDTSVCKGIIKFSHKDIPMMCVCLGHQLLGHVDNCNISRPPMPKMDCNIILLC